MSNHIILTGPQRTGKSFMLEVLTRIGMDTGFTIKDFEKPNNEFFEFRFWGEHYKRNPPYVIKHARLASSLENRAGVFGWGIDRVFIFVRDIDDAVESTIRLDKGDGRDAIKRRFYHRLGKILYQCHKNQWRYSIIEFDKLITDWRYTLVKVQGYVPIDLKDRDFKRAWKETKRRRDEQRKKTDAT